MTAVGSPQGLWFANPGGSNSIPSRTHSSVQRTRSLPVHTTPQTMVMFQQSGKNPPPQRLGFTRSAASSGRRQEVCSVSCVPDHFDLLLSRIGL